jgi:hypothetical protein
MTDTVNTHRESSQDVQVKDHAPSIQQNGSATIDEQNEQNKEAYNASKTKPLHRESSYGQIHKQGPEAYFEADNNAKDNPPPIPHLQQVPRGDSFDNTQEQSFYNGYAEKSWRSENRPGYNKIYTSVMLEDSEHEGRPSVYLFIFVNPLSGDQKGQELTKMAIQSFRLKQAPEVQVQIYNILDDKDRELGFEMLKLVEGMAERDELMPVPQDSKIGKTARRRQIHVWSAGGDGTVMSVFEDLVAHKVNLDIVYFSCKSYMIFPAVRCFSF